MTMPDDHETFGDQSALPWKDRPGIWQMICQQSTEITASDIPTKERARAVNRPIRSLGLVPAAEFDQ